MSVILKNEQEFHLEALVLNPTTPSLTGGRFSLVQLYQAERNQVSSINTISIPKYITKRKVKVRDFGILKSTRERKRNRSRMIFNILPPGRRLNYVSNVIFFSLM